jgi:type IV fimbrial biogenesis protein FimT
LRATLSHARSEALARRAFVVVCPTTDGVACADSDDWSTGYMAFVDTDNDNAADQDDPDEEFIQLENGPRSVDLAFNNGERRIRFNAQGLALGFEGTFTFCDERGAKNARALIVNPGGTMVAATDTDDPGDDIVDDAGDANVACN